MQLDLKLIYDKNSIDVNSKLHGYRKPKLLEVKPLYINSLLFATPTIDFHFT